MAALVQSGKYGDISTKDTTIIGYYYIVNYVSGDFILQEDIATDRQASKAGELAVRAE